MNWNDLINRTVLPFSNDRSLRTYAKTALMDAQEIMILETKCLERQKWLYISSQAEYVDLPDDFVQILRVEYNGQRMKQYRKANIGQLHKTDTTWFAHGTPSHYFLENKRLYLYPGSSGAAWVTIWYTYFPNVLTDNADAYKKLSYDALTAHFIQGETVTGGTSNATGVIEFDDNDMKTGTLTLSSVSGVFQDDEALTGSSNGAATCNGVLSAFETAGDEPDIDEVYRRYLVPYAQAKLFSSSGNFDMSNQLMAEFERAVIRISDKVDERGEVGPARITDTWSDAIG